MDSGIEIRSAVCPSLKATPDAPTPTSIWAQCGISKSGANSIWSVESAPISPRSSQNDGKFFAEPLAPTLQAALRSERCPASHLPVPLIVNVSRGQQPWEFLRRSVGPLWENLMHLREPLATARGCPHSRVAPCPLTPGRITSREFQKTPPAEPFAIYTFASPPRMAPFGERSIPPRTDLSLRGFKLKVASSRKRSGR